MSGVLASKQEYYYQRDVKRRKGASLSLILKSKPSTLILRNNCGYYQYANVLLLTAAIGELMNDSLKCTTLFYPNGTLSQLLIQVQVAIIKVVQWQIIIILL